MSFSKECIAPAVHRTWFHHVLQDPDRTVFIGECNGERIGMVRIDMQPEGCGKVSVATSPEWRGRRLGKALLVLSLKEFSAQNSCSEFIAEVLPHNEASIRLFSGADFVRDFKTKDEQQLTYVYRQPRNMHIESSSPPRISGELFSAYIKKFSFIKKALLAYLAYICVFPLWLSPWLHLRRGVKIKNYKNTYIAANVLIDTSFPEFVEIGEGAYLTRGVKVVAHTAFTPLQQKFVHVDCHIKKIRIGDGVYLGTNAVVLPGVTIGECAFVGASAVVTRDIPPYAIAVGVPAKVIGDIRTFYEKRRYL